MTDPEPRSPVTNVFGFLIGTLILLAFSYTLYYTSWEVSRRTDNAALILAPSAAWLALCIWLEGSGYRLSRILCLPVRPGTSSWFSGVMYGLFGIAWHFVRASQASNEMRSAAAAKAPKRNVAHESLETVVFVVVLVLLLKVFVVEAFVIPTGSMAETLYGYHKELTCDQCGYPFEVNASGEADTSPGRPRAPVVGYCCPNCRFAGRLPLVNLGTEGSPYYAAEQNRGGSWLGRRGNATFGNLTTSGDRVLVHKVLGPDGRGYVVVFKYPVNPQEGQIAQNYIKRCMAFGGETVAIHRGELFVTRALPNPLGDRLAVVPEKDLWQKEYSQFPDTAAAAQLFEENRKALFPPGDGFQLFRKPDDLVMAMRRIVYDNDYQPKDLNAAGVTPRWTTHGDGWADGDRYAKAFKHTGDAPGKLRYQHAWVRTKAETLQPNDAFRRGGAGAMPPRTAFARDLNNPAAPVAPKRITNYLGYNAGASGASFENPYIIPAADVGPPNQWVPSDDNDHWVGDLMAECRVNIPGPAASVTLDLAKGDHRYQAEFTAGEVRLTRIGPGGRLLATRPTKLTAAGTYDLRFANIDCRLRVWVDGERIDFGTEAEYPFETAEESLDPHNEGWTNKNDIEEPAAVHVRGDVEVSALKLWRDTFYTGVSAGQTKTDFLYVQPGHYLCLGDNSSQSSDGRSWGVVPERLLLGRAVFIFFPLHRLGFIR